MEIFFWLVFFLDFFSPRILEFLLKGVQHFKMKLFALGSFLMG